MSDVFAYHALLPQICETDLAQVRQKDREYGAAWKRRGGTGAFHQALARKWDRLETICAKHDYDIFKAMEATGGSESLLDTIGDLRRYLLLIEAEFLSTHPRQAGVLGAEHEGYIDRTGQARPFGFDVSQDVPPNKG